MVIVELPFPPATLSGHVNGNNRWGKIGTTQRWRALAEKTTNAAGAIDLPASGDITVHFHFVPPDRRGDRCNFLTRMKAAIDGIADALGVNDKRFLPSISFGGPEKPGKVIVTIGGE